MADQTGLMVRKKNGDKKGTFRKVTPGVEDSEKKVNGVVRSAREVKKGSSEVKHGIKTLKTGFSRVYRAVCDPLKPVFDVLTYAPAIFLAQNAALTGTIFAGYQALDKLAPGATEAVTDVFNSNNWLEAGVKGTFYASMLTFFNKNFFIENTRKAYQNNKGNSRFKHFKTWAASSALGLLAFQYGVKGLIEDGKKIAEKAAEEFSSVENSLVFNPIMPKAAYASAILNEETLRTIDSYLTGEKPYEVAEDLFYFGGDVRDVVLGTKISDRALEKAKEGLEGVVCEGEYCEDADEFVKLDYFDNRDQFMKGLAIVYSEIASDPKTETEEEHRKAVRAMVYVALSRFQYQNFFNPANHDPGRFALEENPNVFEILAGKVGQTIQFSGLVNVKRYVLQDARNEGDPKWQLYENSETTPGAKKLRLVRGNFDEAKAKLLYDEYCKVLRRQVANPFPSALFYYNEDFTSQRWGGPNDFREFLGEIGSHKYFGYKEGHPRHDWHKMLMVEES